MSLCSCGFGKWEIYELYSQRIEGTDKLIYKYDAWGGRDSHVSGFLILDSKEKFEIDLPNTLPFYNLSNIPSKIKIQGVTTECYNSCGETYYKTKPIFIPKKIKNSTSNGVNIQTVTYQYRGFSEKVKGLRGDYEFEKFVETKDSIYFFNLDDVISVNETHLDELKIKKGEIYLNENENGEVNKIVVEYKNLNTQTKEIIDGGTYFLKPRNKIKSSDFSERGIFHKVKVMK